MTQTVSIGIAIHGDDIAYAKLIADIVRKKLEHDGVEHFIVIERGTLLEKKT